MKTARHIRLDSGDHPDSVRFLTGLSVRLAEGVSEENPRVTVTITRTGSFTDPRYGRFSITKEMLLSFVKNFESGVVGREISIDRAHHPDDGAAAKIVTLSVEGNRLRGEIEFTPFGIDLVKNRGFRYLSADYHEDWVDNEEGNHHGPTLLGAGLTVRPVVRHLDPIQLSESEGDKHATLLHPELEKTLTEEIQAMWKDLIKSLSESLKKLKLPDDVAKKLSDSFTKAIEGVTDEAQAKILLQAFEAGGKNLSEQLEEIRKTGTSRDIKLDFGNLDQALASMRGGGGLSADDVRKLLAEEESKKAEEAKKLKESREEKVKVLTDALDAAEGLKSLSEETRTELHDAAVNLITPEMTDEQVKALAEHQIKMGNQIAVASQLAARGWNGPAGSVHILVDEANAVKKLQETIDKRLGLTDMSPSRRYERTGGVLLDENKRLAEEAMKLYDSIHGPELHKEAKQLAAGDSVVSDVNVPVVWERTVIREALYQMVGLNFVNGGTESFATSYMIPYSFRDTAAAGRDSTRKYEGQAVARAGVTQTAETAYNIPQKLAFEVSDELRYLTAARHLDWDAVQENQRNATRIIAEDGDRIILNETVHASDEFGAVAVVNENLELQADGAKNVFILAQFPVVRPRSVFDLQGNQVGSTVNPITVTYDSVVRSEYDGTGTQPAGTYYTLDYNLGEISLVDEAGTLIVPVDTTPYTISYSYATNVYNFDSDLGGALAGDHWDTFLYRYGLRKSVIEDDRFHMANFGLMRGTPVTQIEQAKQFGANHRRPGTDLAADGTLGRIKDVPNFKAFGPGLWMADNRVVIGERGITRFRMSKPWTLGELQDQKDANGRFTGKKEAYGDQFIVVHTPTQLKRAYTTLNIYSATARVARVA